MTSTGPRRILRPSHHVGAKEEEKRTGDKKDQPLPVRARRVWITHRVVERESQRWERATGTEVPSAFRRVLG